MYIQQLKILTCIVPETTPVQKSRVLVVEILQGHFLLLLEAGSNKKKNSSTVYSIQLSYNR